MASLQIEIQLIVIAVNLTSLRARKKKAAGLKSIGMVNEERLVMAQIKALEEQAREIIAVYKIDEHIRFVTSELESGD